MLEPVKLRKAQREDLGQMIPMINRAFAIENFFEDDTTRTDMERIVPMFEAGEFLVMEEDRDGSKRIIASGYTEPRGEGAYFGMLAVEPSEQRRGLGRMMFKAVEEHCRARGAKWVELAVLSLRPSLLPFYRSLGYEECGTEEFRASRPLKKGLECHLVRMRKGL